MTPEPIGTAGDTIHEGGSISVSAADAKVGLNRLRQAVYATMFLNQLTSLGEPEEEEEDEELKRQSLANEFSEQIGSLSHFVDLKKLGDVSELVDTIKADTLGGTGDDLAAMGLGLAKNCSNKSILNALGKNASHSEMPVGKKQSIMSRQTTGQHQPSVIATPSVPPCALEPSPPTLKLSRPRRQVHRLGAELTRRRIGCPRNQQLRQQLPSLRRAAIEGAEPPARSRSPSHDSDWSEEFDTAQKGGPERLFYDKSQYTGAAKAHQQGFLGIKGLNFKAEDAGEYLAGRDVENLGIAWASMPPGPLLIKEVELHAWAGSEGIKAKDEVNDPSFLRKKAATSSAFGW